jgi:2,4-dienoyl-CoA reductase-like NADH-dependent reductase (Old Yellow Enzyme family)
MNPSTPRLFTSLSLRSLTLPNRIVVAPMCQYEAIDGDATAWHHVHLGSLACGSPGLLLLEATAVDPRGRITPGCLGLWSDSNEAALVKVLETIRRVAPATPVGIQLAHAGMKASRFRPFDAPRRGYVTPAEGGWQPVGMSAIPSGGDGPVAEALDDRGLAAIRDAFAAAAGRAARIGFDLVELHSAHGYLLSSSLSPLTNHRTDRYGGSRENRMRFALETFEAMRAAMPAAMPLGVRFSGTDWADEQGGWTAEDSVAYAAELKARGCDYAHLSSGGNASGVSIEATPGFQVPLAAAVKRGTGIVTIAVGELQDPHLAEKVLADGDADLVAIGKGMLRDPRWPWHAAEALGHPFEVIPNYRWCVPVR